MSLFSSILGGAASLIPGIGPIAGPLVAGIAGNIGSNRAQGQEQAAAQQAAQASAPFSVFSPSGSATVDQDNRSLTLGGIPPHIQAVINQSDELGRHSMNLFSNFNAADAEDEEFNRLQALRQPSISRARSRLQSQLLNRGRIGVGIGGGRGGRHYNPETAAQEEAILRAQLGDVGAARGFAQQKQSFLLNQARGLFAQGRELGAGPASSAALGIAARMPAGVAALQAQPGFNKADTTRGFFSGLGTTLGGAIEGGGFFGGADPRDVDWTGGGRNDGYGQTFYNNE